LLKIAIAVLFIAMLASLFSGLGFLFLDQGKPGSKRILYALGIRVCLAASLLLLVLYGFYTGKLELDAPWHRPEAVTTPVTE